MVTGIEHSVYHDKKVHVLYFQDAEGKDVSIGVIMPGDYVIDVAEQDETIKVLLGSIATRERVIFPGPDDSINVKRGDKIKLSCFVPTAFFCQYGD